MNGVIYIISYFGNNDKEFRKKVHKKQLLFWLKEKNYNIKILAMEYNKSDYINNNRIEYIKLKEHITQSKARNILLKEFYNSNYDFCIFMDNDSILRINYSDMNIENYEDTFKYIDIFFPINPRVCGYKNILS